jgi:hypothetical protein
VSLHILCDSLSTPKSLTQGLTGIVIFKKEEKILGQIGQVPFYEQTITSQ